MKQPNQNYYKVVDNNNITKYVPVQAYERLEGLTRGLQTKYKKIVIDYTVSRIDDKVYVRSGPVGSDIFVALSDESKVKKTSVAVIN